MFPLDHWFRTGIADFLAEHRFRGSGPLAISAHQDALRDDPWSPALRRNLAGFLVEAGRIEEATHEVEMVAHLTPRSQIQLRVNVNPATR